MKMSDNLFERDEKQLIWGQGREISGRDDDKKAREA